MTSLVEQQEAGLGRQVGGDHYRRFKIQPVEFIVANGLGFLAGNIIKYATRYAFKGGAADIRKIIHYCELILEFEYGDKKKEPECGQQHPGMGGAALPAANYAYMQQYPPNQQYPANRCLEVWIRSENRCMLAENHDGEHCFELFNVDVPYLSPIDPRHD
jgi:Protein of unknwon function (DUF3310)